ncbi:MAG: flagellar filament capping protein FliD [Phycisphaerales bacterium]|nr:flagellar filament capping protein FliD [Phycisphaerales bacterium]
MGGITSGIGLFSGIDTGSLIEQLLSLQARPQILAQQRIIQLQTQQAAFLDVNSRLNTLKSAAASFRVENIFKGKSSISSNEDVLTATAGIGALSGSYNFIVDRLVSTQQLLSRGFSDADNSAIGLSSLTFEGSEARLDRQTALADFNNGDGVSRGKILVNGTEVDLSRVGTVDELLNEINSNVAGVNAFVENDRIVIEGVTSLQNGAGYSVLGSLGLSTYSGASTDLTGTAVYGLGTNTALSSFNDGRGVSTRDTVGIGVADFNIVVGGTTVGVRIGEIQTDDGEGGFETTSGVVSTASGVIERINTALSDAGFADVTASINASTGAIDIVDTTGGRTIDITEISLGGTTFTTASDLGLLGSFTGSQSGQRIFAGINSTLVSSLNGGNGLNGATSDLSFTTRDGAVTLIDISGANDFNDIINTINQDPSGKLTATLNDAGNGIQITDNTSGVTTFTIAGNDTATALGIDGSFASGVAEGTNLQLAYLGRASRLDELNNGSGIGIGKFDIVDSNGVRVSINITGNDQTLGDIIDAINSGADTLAINARINDTGDGIIIEETGTPGGGAIEIADTDGSVASKLRIAGTATGTGAENFIDGSFETTVTFEPGATLNDIVTAVNESQAGVSLSVVNTGIGSAPFRLNVASTESGSSGRFVIDTNGFDLGLSSLDRGNDAQIFFGSTDPALGVLLSSSTNQFDNVIQGTTIDIKSTSDDPVTLSISNDTETIESKIEEFVSAFNDAISNIDFQTRFDAETEVRGTLLGDGTVNQLRNGLFSALRQPNDGFTTAFDRLVQVGITVESGGKIEFDKDKFRDAYNQDPAAVEALFTTRTLTENDDGDENTIDEITLAEVGAMVRIEEFVDRYVNSISGILQNRNTAIGAQIKSQEDRIEQLQIRLNSQRQVLQRQFLAMEKAIAASQNQSGALSQISALG